MKNPYGYCPHCGSPGVSRERRIDGNDRCKMGHIYPSAKAHAEAGGLDQALKDRIGAPTYDLLLSGIQLAQFAASLRLHPNDDTAWRFQVNLRAQQYLNLYEKWRASGAPIAPEAVSEACSDCCEAAGGIWPAGHTGVTVSSGKCPACERQTILFPLGDFNWPKGLPAGWIGGGRD